MRRLDWQLVRPDGDGTLDESLQLLVLIRRLSTKEAAGDLHEEETELLLGAEDAYYDTTLAQCDAVEAPTVEEDPHWETRLIDEFAVTDVDMDMELEDYLDVRRREPDCDRCPYASPYNVFPMERCEFSAGGLEEALTDAALCTRLAQPMQPADMLALAADLERAVEDGAWREIDAVDTQDYLAKAILFLRFWANHGFGVLPTDVDEIIDFTGRQSATTAAEDDEPPVFH